MADADHYLVVGKVRERLIVNKCALQAYLMERFNLSATFQSLTKFHIKI
jgi:hypothetical protein